MKLRKSIVFVALMVCFVLAGLSSAALAQGLLTSEEEAGLLQMREEEKLARDVYAAMFEKWRKRIFDNIRDSEQRHMDAVQGLLDRYDLEDPAEGKDFGSFTNEQIGMLYTGLLKIGSDSLVKALCVGVFIEEMDIEDLEGLLKEMKKQDIKRVYTNLLAGSYLHLETFNEQLDLLDATCESYQQEFEDILASHE